METLDTIVTEIEAVMNDRPLTHVSSNINDLEPFIMVYQMGQKQRYRSNAILLPLERHILPFERLILPFER